jgi:hypothetical protein
MQLAEAFEPEQQAAEFVLPAKNTLNSVEPLLEDRLIEKWLAATFGGFSASGICVDVWRFCGKSSPETAAVYDRRQLVR